MQNDQSKKKEKRTEYVCLLIYDYFMCCLIFWICALFVCHLSNKTFVEFIIQEMLNNEHFPRVNLIIGKKGKTLMFQFQIVKYLSFNCQ